MASRYGRKKRRQHREMILDLQCTERFLRQQLAGREREVWAQRRKIEEFQERFNDWNDRVCSLLGPYTSAAINDTTYRVDDLHTVRQMPVMPRLEPVDFSRGPEAIPAQLEYYMENILHLIADLPPRDSTSLARRMFFDIEMHGYRQRSAAYGFSEMMFRDLMRDGERGIRILARKIAPQIAQLLLAEKKQEERRRA